MYYRSYSPYDEDPYMGLGNDEGTTLDEILNIKPVKVHVVKTHYHKTVEKVITL